jgi:predicted kinase
MLSRLLERILPSIIGIVLHSRERFTDKERAALEASMAKLKTRKRDTHAPIIVAMIGLVGSGKTTLARYLSGFIGATVISADDIRIELRKRRESLDRARAIAEDMAIRVIKGGGNVVLDSDFIDQKKRASLKEKARKVGARIAFVRAYAEPDDILGRITTSPAEEFFYDAATIWEGSSQEKGVVVKLREFWRRTPQHYSWKNKVGGKWKLKKLPFALLADINTSNPEWESHLRNALLQLDFIEE